MPLGNYVIFENGVPERLHFAGHSKKIKDLTDPLTGLPAGRNAVDFAVDRLNGVPVVTTLSVIADSLYIQLEPFVEGKKYLDYDFLITHRGSGYSAKWSVTVIPLKPQA